jgi:hypothetical protein
MRTKTNALLCAAFIALVSVLLSSCNAERRANRATTTVLENTTLGDLQRDKVEHVLSEDQTVRAKEVQEALSEVDPSPLERWLDDFSRDDDPEGELQIWEAIATAYQGYCRERSLSLEQKMEIHRILLIRSMVDEQAAIRRVSRIGLKYFTVEEAQRIMSLYRLEPKPIEIRIDE